MPRLLSCDYRQRSPVNTNGIERDRDEGRDRERQTRSRFYEMNYRLFRNTCQLSEYAFVLGQSILSSTKDFVRNHRLFVVCSRLLFYLFFFRLFLMVSFYFLLNKSDTIVLVTRVYYFRHICYQFLSRMLLFRRRMLLFSSHMLLFWSHVLLFWSHMLLI